MSLLQAIILGIFQGIAEFLPISSSGHLAVLQNLFNIKEGNLFFTEMLHFGTLISIVVVYFNDIIKMIVEFFKLINTLFYNTYHKKKKQIRLNSHQKLALLIIMGSIPTAIIGLTFEDFFESLYTSLLPIGFAFLITGLLLWISEKKAFQNKDIEKMSFLDSIIIGIAQGLAIFPGISRSGSTIVAGLMRGLKKPLATEYSFLLALPATFGAGLLGILKVIKSDSPVTINVPLAIGVVLSTIVGIISIKILIKLLNKNKLHYFSYYLWFIGILTIFSQII